MPTAAVLQKTAVADARRTEALPDFSTVTELPSSHATPDQCAILYSRYHLAREFARGGDVLEVGCGSGIGLGYLAGNARRVVGGDIHAANCRVAALTYRDAPRIAVEQLDAQLLPFEAGSFDLVVLFEALYYLRNPDAFFEEAHRVMRPGGSLVLSSVNCEWSAFHPSPFSTKYFAAPELRELLALHGYSTRVLAGFPESRDRGRSMVAYLARRAAVYLHLIPGTMRGKEWLKRLFYGPLVPLPAQLPDNFAPLEPLKEISDHDDTSRFRMLYAIGRRD